MRVHFFEIFESEKQSIQKYLDSNIDTIFTPQTFQTSDLQLIPADLISIRTQSVLPTDWHLLTKAVLSRSTGSDHLISFLKKGEYHLGFLPEYCSGAVAEHALMMIMMLFRKMKKQMDQFSVFNREQLTGRELYGKRVLVCGVGRIGYQIYQLCKNMNMQCEGHDIDPRYPDVTYVALSAGIRQADVIVCALPCNDQTAGLLNYEMLSAGSSNKIVVNISRGEVTPIMDLERLLDENKISGVGLDVFEEEFALGDKLRSGGDSLSLKHKVLMRLHRLPNVICTPHNAFNSEESLNQKALETAEAIQHYRKHGKFKYEVLAKS